MTYVSVVYNGNNAKWDCVDVRVEGSDPSHASLIRNEIPAGSINGSNTAFTLASAPATGSARVYLNGVRQKVTDDYTISGSTITFVTAPPSGSNLLVDYEVSNTAYSVGTNSYIAKEAVTGSVNGINADFTTARPYIAGSLQVFINGLMQSHTQVNETNPATGGFGLDASPASGDVIHVAYQYNLNPSGNADTVDGIHASTTATANQLYPLKALTTDANGWTVYDFGLFKQYRKKGTWSASIGASAWAQQGSSNLPVGKSTIGTMTLDSSLGANDAAISVHSMNSSLSTSSSITFAVQNNYSGSISYTGYYSLCLTEV
jgi:hypothetical protein